MYAISYKHNEHYFSLLCTRMRFKKKRDDVKALHATMKELQGIDPLDYLAKFVLTQLAHYPGDKTCGFYESHTIIGTALLIKPSCPITSMLTTMWTGMRMTRLT